MNIRFYLFMVFFGFCCSLSSRDIGMDLCENAGEVWNLKPAQLAGKYGSKKAFKWKSPLKKKMLYCAKSAKDEFLFMKQQIAGGTFCFANNRKLRGMYIHLAIPKNADNMETYNGFIANLKKQMEQFGKFDTPRLRKHRAGNKHGFTYAWKSREYYASLSWSYSSDSNKFTPGKVKVSIFARVSFTETTPAKDSQDTASDNAGNDAQEGPLNKNDKGDFSLKVQPEQAKPGESSAAVCLKSLLKFKKYPVKNLDWDKINERLDMNVKSAKGATRIYARISQECNCRVKRIASSSVFDDFNTITAFIRDYNREASKAGKPRISSFKYSNSFSKLLEVLDEDILAQTRNQDKKAEKFKSKVIKELKKGDPVIWIVFLGVVKEKPLPPVSRGIHVRLITGFNPKENSLIYADCWGKGHDSKKMSWEKAWGITLEAMTATPKD